MGLRGVDCPSHTSSFHRWGWGTRALRVVLPTRVYVLLRRQALRTGRSAGNNRATGPVALACLAAGAAVGASIAGRQRSNVFGHGSRQSIPHGHGAYSVIAMLMVVLLAALAPALIRPAPRGATDGRPRCLRSAAGRSPLQALGAWDLHHVDRRRGTAACPAAVTATGFHGTRRARAGHRLELHGAPGAREEGQ